ncbi:MAG: DNA internalization-related competence protein ComEC/Rec2 [Pseudomonadaceae bacterium]
MNDLRLLLICLMAGLLCPLVFEVLPPWWAFAAGGAALGALYYLRSLSSLRALLLFSWAMTWSLYWHQCALDARLPQALDNQRVAIVGRVDALPMQTETGWRFVLRDVRDEQARPLPDMRLHWWGGEPVAAGEVWVFEARLRRPRGMRNPGTFDYESWLYAQGIGATGSVEAGTRLATAPAFGQWRDRLQAKLAEPLAKVSGGTRLLALLIGDRQALSRDDWDLLQATGTTHLLVISGLHIGMLAAAVFALTGLVLRWLPVAWSRPQLWLSAPVALLAAAGYAGLAGMGVPVQRALLMCLLVLLLKLWRRRLPAIELWLLAMVMVTAINPAAPLRAGYWLSFMAVGLLLLGMGGRLHVRGLWWRWGRAQWVAFVGLWPFLLLWGLPTSGVAMLVNLLAIPWVSLFVVPAGLIGAGIELLFGVDQILLLAAHLLNLLLRGLGWVAGWAGLLRLPFPGWVAWLVALAGVLVWLLPVAVFRPLALLCLLPLLLPEQQRPEPGEARVVVLDVGQGLSVLVQTATHDLLYDAGARLRSGFDLGEAVVAPALTGFGVRKLDMLLLSHADSDHAGGALAVVRQVPAMRVVSGEAEQLPVALSAEACRTAEAWSWDGVRFRLLQAQDSGDDGNARSCVLQVWAGQRSVLLPGDIAKADEAVLLGLLAPADLLLAPHHGSRGSSSYAFIRRLNPDWVVFSAAHHNPFGHPHPQVVERYRELGSEAIYTGGAGAVSFILSPVRPVFPEWRWRDAARRFWHE